MSRPRPVVLRNWRVIAFEVIVLLVAAALWGLLTAGGVEAAARDSSLRETVLAVLFGVVMVVFVAWIAGTGRQRVIVTPARLVVKNVLHSHEIAWGDLRGLRTDTAYSTSGRWYITVALLIESERTVSLMGTFTLRPDRSRQYLDELRRLAPRGAATNDTVATTPVPAARRPPHPVRRRLVVRSTTLAGNITVTLCLWAGVALIAVIVSSVLLAEDNAPQFIGGLATLAAVAAITEGLRRATVARVIVTRQGVKTRGMSAPSRVALDWMEVADLTVTPIVNDRLTRVVGVLNAVTTSGTVHSLYPTQRHLREIQELRGDMLAYRH
ncbi:MAG: PH domain-containing protein [Acidimicrobiales bacterium]